MHLLQAGVSLIYICDFLGHEDIKTTEIYAKYDIENGFVGNIKSVTQGQEQKIGL